MTASAPPTDRGAAQWWAIEAYVSYGGPAQCLSDASRNSAMQGREVRMGSW